MGTPVLGVPMKERLIKIINRKINYLTVNLEEAKRSQNLFEMNFCLRSIELLRNIIREIQSES
jgi:hypothetical protein